MGLTDNISDNGTYNITTLKQCTGISDDRLSAHHPNGAGNTTSLGDFVCKGIGRNTTSGTDTDPLNWHRYLYLSDVVVNNSSQNASGSYDGNNWYVFTDSGLYLSASRGDTFKVRIEFFEVDLGDLFGEQIAKDPDNLQVNTGNIVNEIGRSLITSNGKPIAIDVEFEVVGYAPNFTIGFTWKDHMNTSGLHYGTTGSPIQTAYGDMSLVFQTEEVEDATPLLATSPAAFYMRVYNNGTGDYEVDFNIGYSEGNVVSDPANEIDAQFYMYKEGVGTPYTNSTDPTFQYSNNMINQFVSEVSAGELETFQCEIRDQGGTTKDWVTITLDEQYGAITLPSSGQTKCYKLYSNNTTRNPATSRTNAVQLTNIEEVSC